MSYRIFSIAMVFIVIIFSLVMGSVALYVSVQEYKKTKTFVESGVTTTAVVIDLGRKYIKHSKEMSKYDGYYYEPVLEYSDLEGNKRTFKYNTHTASTEIRHPIGEEIEIIYQKKKPYRERENSFLGLYLLSTSGISMGILFLSIAAWGIISAFKNIKIR